ncbi:Hpt domain-containing protein [Luteibacter yeojuensis]|uniref:Chemotaxis protein CheA n=1 Tax=Luteibacter yeojuensis TaxID=345309 RepID=A0A0F3K689_9GAMM|nr:Hpt domain-containing protein [Luteibacter yeojuensis]KJV26686.1 chemotaxis protein CheA [Luteibacter yeojuensis]
MRLQDHTDFTTLHWVKAELDDALSKARQALESYVEDSRDAYVMHTCAADLHQVHGTLRMVELYGAAMVVGEMEQLVAALISDRVANRDEAYAALMRGMMQMPDYLERLQSGHRDVPIVLLPLLNDLRASRGEQSLHESALFTPNLDTPLPLGAPGAADPGVAEAHRGELPELRARFQQQLLAWFRGQGGERQLLGMRGTLDSIAARCYTIAGRRLWWIAAGVLEGLERGVLRAHEKDVRQLIGRVDRSIRELVDGGEEAMLTGDSDDLARKLLYYVAQAKPGSERVEELRQAYRLDGLLPRAAEVEHARGSMSGHNRALLDTVSAAIKEDLLRVKESLDLFLRRPDGDPGQLGPQADVLDRVGDTLGMLALGVPRRVVGEQRRILGEIATGTRAPDEESLLDVAGALLYVEASLDDHIERLGAEGETPMADTGPSPLPRSEARHILSTLMREATTNTSRVKDAIVGFVESQWDHEQLAGTPELMGEIGGAMRMLGAPRPAELADGIGLFIHRELLGDRRVPNGTQMDRLADALAALEYYLEAAREHRGGLDHILDVTQQSLAELGYWPVPVDAADDEGLGEEAIGGIEAEAVEHIAVPASSADEGEQVSSFADTFDLVDEPPAEPAGTMAAGSVAAVAAEPVAALPDEDWVEIEEEIEQEVGGDSGVAEFAGFQITVDGIDDEIREIFLEETQEEIENLRAGLAAWLPNPERPDALTPVRRSFHTLKGSGRLVGARLLGEFAWKVENMLNRVLDGSIGPHEGVQALVRHAVDALPQLKAALEGDENVTAPIAAIMETADRLAMGDMAFVEDVARNAVQKVRTKVKRRVPRDTIAAVPTAAFAGYGQPPAAEPEPAPAEEPAYVAPPLPPVDAVLLDILRTEVAQYLHIIRANLALAGDGELPVDDALLRAVHTLHGAIGMVDIPVLIQVLAPLEGLIKRVRASGVPLRPEGVDALTDTADLVDHVMDLFDTEDPRVPGVAALAAHITALRDEQPEATVAHILYEPDPQPVDEPVHDEPEHDEPEPVVDAFDVVDGDAAGEHVAGEHVAEEDVAEEVDEDVADESFVDVPQPEASLPAEPLHEAPRLDEPAAEPEAEPAVAALATDEPSPAPLSALDEAELDAFINEDARFEADVRAAEAHLAADTADTAEEKGANDDLVAPEASAASLEAELEAMLAGELAELEAASAAHADEEAEDEREAGTDEPMADAGAEPVEERALPGIEFVAEEQDLTAQLMASMEGFTIDRPQVEPITQYDPAQEAEWRALAASELPQPMSHDGDVLHADDGVLPEEPADAAEIAPIEEPVAFVAADAPAEPAEPAEPVEDTWLPEALDVTAVIEDQAHEPLAEPVDPPLDDYAPALVPELSPYADIDPDLLEVFVEEGREILDHADAALAAWRAEPQQGEHVASLQRDLHTLKGSARMAGLAAIGDFAHAMEALLDAVAGGQRESDTLAIEAMESGFDRLHRMILAVAKLQPVSITDTDVEPFARLAGAPIAPDLLTAESYRDEREAAQPEPIVPPAAPEPEPIPVLDRVLPDLLPEMQEEEIQRASQEQIRVRADMLDTLVNHAGEVSIYRSRLEQQTASFRSTLTEHEQTVSRLRSQLRMLEIETETQIIARYHQENRDTAAAFDPLELDRFSQLQQYSRALAESVSDLVSLQTMMDDLTRQTETLLLQQQKVNAELQEGLMQTRMLPFDAMVPNLRRTLRQAANDVGKRAQLVVEGANGEMDRNMLDRIKAPFEHMLRNAVAHGIEAPQAREEAGKNPEGTVRIQVAREATEVVVRLSDDGAGMDRDAIRDKAIERGLLRPDARVSDDQIFQLTQVPGFSTAEKVTQVAGRGVGMDVVANEIKQLGGTLGIESQRGTGTTFVMRLPFTLAVTQALIVRIGETNFAIPMTSVHGVANVEPNELAHRMADEDPQFGYAGEDYAIHDLPQLLGVHVIGSPDEGDIPLLLARSGDLRAAIRVDAVLGSREIVVKPVGPQVSSVPGILGATIMGDGSVLMILDLAPLVRHGVARRAFEAEAAIPQAPRKQDEVRVKPLVMVVDDSITMRKVTGRVLERNEFEVMTAKDGVDALEKLNERVPDLMLLDIEMPRMDGYELATAMKADERLAGVPIIMITSRTGDKHRQRAFDIGVDRYIGKPYQENDLVVQINDVLGVTHGG